VLAPLDRHVEREVLHIRAADEGPIDLGIGDQIKDC